MSYDGPGRHRSGSGAIRNGGDRHRQGAVPNRVCGHDQRITRGSPDDRHSADDGRSKAGGDRPSSRPVRTSRTEAQVREGRGHPPPASGRRFGSVTRPTVPGVPPYDPQGPQRQDLCRAAKHALARSRRLVAKSHSSGCALRARAVLACRVAGGRGQLRGPGLHPIPDTPGSEPTLVTGTSSRKSAGFCRSSLWATVTPGRSVEVGRLSGRYFGQGVEPPPSCGRSNR
jgi:hypothetical protein